MDYGWIEQERDGAWMTFLARGALGRIILFFPLYHRWVPRPVLFVISVMTSFYS